MNKRELYSGKLKNETNIQHNNTQGNVTVNGGELINYQIANAQ